VANDQVIPAQCDGVVTAWLESLLGVEKWSSRTESRGPPAQRTLHNHDPGPGPLGSTCEGTKGSPLVHCKPVTMVTPSGE
jgi:hypothetical protein